MPIDNACPATQTDVRVRRSTAWTPEWSKFFSGLVYWVVDRQQAYRHHIHLSQLDSAARRDLGLPDNCDTWDGFDQRRF